MVESELKSYLEIGQDKILSLNFFFKDFLFSLNFLKGTLKIFVRISIS